MLTYSIEQSPLREIESSSYTQETHCPLQYQEPTTGPYPEQGECSAHTHSFYDPF
jgi:hypothetical protein